MHKHVSLNIFSMFELILYVINYDLQQCLCKTSKDKVNSNINTLLYNEQYVNISTNNKS